jgi:hypothetical protein
VLFEARDDDTEVFELIEEALDQIPEPIKVGTEDRDVDAPWHARMVATGGLSSQAAVAPMLAAWTVAVLMLNWA